MVVPHLGRAWQFHIGQQERVQRRSQRLPVQPDHRSTFGEDRVGRLALHHRWQWFNGDDRPTCGGEFLQQGDRAAGQRHPRGHDHHSVAHLPHLQRRPILTFNLQLATCNLQLFHQHLIA